MTRRKRLALIETRAGQTVLMLVVAVGVPVLIGVNVADRRGWLVGLASGLIFAMLFGAGFWPSLRAWSRAHPLLDGAILGPLGFVGACFIEPLPIWACLLTGAVATGAGVLMGGRRRVHWRAQE